VIVTTPGTGKPGEPIGPPVGSPLPQGGPKPGTANPKPNPKPGPTGFDGGNVEPPVSGSGSIAIPEATNGQNLDVVPPAVVPNIPAVPSKSPF